MKFYLVKKTDECDGGGCDAPISVSPDGMGPVIPGESGDRFDNILGIGYMNPNKKRYKVIKRKSRK
jgi:hypothetical protein